MTVRRVLRLSLAGLLGVALLAVAGPAHPAVEATTPYTKTVEPWIPGQVPQTPPVVNLTAACVRRTSSGQLEAVFGYDNRSGTSVYAEIEDEPTGGTEVNRNVIVRERFQPRQTTIEQFGPQATLFLPGKHPHAFAVRFDVDETVAWQVQVPSSDPFGVPSWKVTVRPRMHGTCGRSVPTRFAVVQRTDVSLGPANIVRDGGNIVAYDMVAENANVRTVCSTGGTPAPFEQTIGWSSLRAVNVAPLTPQEIVDDLETEADVWQFTARTTRAVGNVAQSVEVGRVLTDVYGRCVFGATTVTSEVFWGEQVSLFTVVEPIFSAGGDVIDLVPAGVAPPGFRVR